MPNHSNSDTIALNFLALRQQEFSFDIHRRRLMPGETSENTYSLPDDPSSIFDEGSRPETFGRYAVSLVARDDFEEIAVGAWTNPWITLWVLRHALEQVCKSAPLASETELPEDDFAREVAFVLRRHEAGIRDVVWVRPYELKAIGKFGFLAHFSLRVPQDSPVAPKRKLELSLTHKNGKLNEDFYLDQFEKIEDFLRRFYGNISSLRLHDGSSVEIDKKLSVLRSFRLSKRTYRFANGREHANPFFGLRDFGPIQGPAPNSRLVFLFPELDRAKSQDLFRALRGDSYPTFPGMQSIFKMNFDRENVSGLPIDGFNNGALRDASTLLKAQYPNDRVVPVVLVPMSKHSSDEESDAYFRAKHAFLSEGLASQFVDRKRVDDRTALKWSVSNIGLAMFAKMGGVPWCLRPSTEGCLVVGIGQSHRIVNRKVERYFAYSVLADSSGMYESIRVLGSSSDPDEYDRSLTRNLRDVLVEHKDRYSSFVLHLTFSMKKREIDAIRALLKELHNGEFSSGHEFIALKFNDHNDFLGFSVAHNSRIPSEGAVVPLSKKEFLLWFSGLGTEDSKAPKKPERPVHVQILYPATPLSKDDLRRVLQDAMNIAGANWRGFNAKSLPISIYYAKLIAEYYAHFRDADLPDLNIEDLSPWFL
jgi:hypothetical protein